jgi:hypothetical protein
MASKHTRKRKQDRIPTELTRNQAQAQVVITSDSDSDSLVDLDLPTKMETKVMTDESNVVEQNSFLEQEQVHGHTEVAGPAGYDLSNIALPSSPPVASGGNRGGGAIMMTNPNDGTQVSRKDYMCALAKAGWNRNQIFNT